MTDLALTREEAAALLKVHPATLRRWTKAGKLPVSRPNGGAVRYRLADLVALIDGSLQYEGEPNRQQKPRQSMRVVSGVTRISPIDGLPYREVG